MDSGLRHDEERFVLDDGVVRRDLGVERVALTQAQGGVWAAELNGPARVIAGEGCPPAILRKGRRCEGEDEDEEERAHLVG